MDFVLCILQIQHVSLSFSYAAFQGLLFQDLVQLLRFIVVDYHGEPFDFISVSELLFVKGCLQCLDVYFGLFFHIADLEFTLIGDLVFVASDIDAIFC
jgi:hypothetical protein